VSDADIEHDSQEESTLDLEPFDDTSVDETEASQDPPPAGRSRRQAPDKGLLLACLVIACGLFAIIWGVTSALTGDDGIDRPTAIEELSPVENALQVFQQQQIRVNLQPGYEAYLIVDGIRLETTNIGQVEVNPENDGQQLSIPPTAVFDPGNAVITFRPSDDAVITSFSEGRHTAQVVFWRIEEGPGEAESYRWSFEVV
jgi:hypothetical protein